VTMKYIELNPVRARFCRRAWLYDWSSAAAHTDESARSDLLNLTWWYKQFSGKAWRKALSEGLTEEEVARLRTRTHTGRPLGSDAFLSQLEVMLGRRVRPLPIGRPRKSVANKDRGKKGYQYS
jgi:putative transposase